MIRTRFAPSPTGYLHIGGVRTALFNWLLAKQSGGHFILRIDDTDADRNVDAALQPILEGFKWLGMTWDEGPEVGGPHGPYFQSQRGDLYREAIAKLLASGHAYQDFAKPDELQTLRDAAREKNENFLYDRRWMAQSDADVAKFQAEGREGVVRLKMPREGQCVINDLVRGEVIVDWAGEPDHVIARGDGSPLYHLASVVDDHAFKITHVVRAAEHLPNTPRQVFIAQSLGYELPVYAHLPYVAEPGGTAKLSKRKLDKYLKNRDFANLMARGKAIADRCQIITNDDTFNPVLVDFYREIGFLPEALLNYLILLGWSLDGEREKFSVDEMIELFRIERVNSAPASFDPAKLSSFQGDAFASLSDAQRTERVRPFAIAAGWVTAGDTESENRLAAVVTAASDRLKMAGDIIDFDYCFIDDYEINDKAYQKRIIKPDNAVPLLKRLRTHFEGVDDFSVESVDASVHQFCENESIGLGDIIHALRVATTGAAGGFGMFETLNILGKSRTLDRIDRVLAAVG